MSVQEPKKNVPIYFYYLTISKQKDSNDSSIYDIQQIVDSFSKLLSYITAKNLTDRKKDITSSEKVVWLDSFEDLKNGNYNIIFKSAKYNHVRNEIDTETMTELGTRKRQQDGDEEKTHLCIRLEKGQCRFLAVHESNHYGISINCIIDYLNTQFVTYNEDTDDNHLVIPPLISRHTAKKRQEIHCGEEPCINLRCRSSIKAEVLTQKQSEDSKHRIIAETLTRIRQS